MDWIQVSALPPDLQDAALRHLDGLRRRPPPPPPEPAPEGPLRCGCPEGSASWDGAAWICAPCSGLAAPGEVR